MEHNVPRITLCTSLHLACTFTNMLKYFLAFFHNCLPYMLFLFVCGQQFKALKHLIIILPEMPIPTLNTHDRIFSKHYHGSLVPVGKELTSSCFTLLSRASFCPEQPHWYSQTNSGKAIIRSKYLWSGLILRPSL